MENNKPNIVFFGTPHFVVHVLDALIDADLAPSLVVTQPERPAGRGLQPRPVPVKMWADEHKIPTLEPERLDASVLETLQKMQPDLFIVAGYGKIIPEEILALPHYGSVNVHPSLLPKYRGPSPIETQILENVSEVGVSVILLDEETDHGPILAQKAFKPKPWPPMRSELEVLLWREGGTLLANSILPYMGEQLVPKEQNHSQATFTEKLEKEDGRIDISGDPYRNYLKYCAYEGWPGTFFFAEKNGKPVRVKIVRAEFVEGRFRPLRVIPEGKKETDYSEFLKN